MFFLRKHKQNEDEEFYNFFRNVLGFTPKHTEVYQVAFIHRSLSQTAPHGHRINNERLEFLGDAVLSAIVADYLYQKFPFQGEGFMTEMRSKLVSRSNLNQLAKKIGLSQLVRYNKSQQGIFKSIDGDAFEALMGAIYLEKGYQFTRKVLVERIINMHIDIDALSHKDWNYKSKLIDWGQKKRKKVSFAVVRTMYQTDSGMSRREYEVQVMIDEQAFDKAISFSIKSAEQLAAEKTYKRLLGEGVIEAD